MPPRRFTAASASVNEVSDMDSDGFFEEEEEEEPIPVKCRSCDEEYEADDAGTCKACYENSNENQEKLKREIDDLRSKVSFLKLPSPSSQDSVTYGHSLGPTDVILVPSGDPSAPADASVPAHRAVLAIRSPVFKAMLENYMKESRSGTINMDDVKWDTLQEFVNYLYTAEATLDEQKAHDLLKLGEKYQVNHLKEHCEKYLISTLNLDNNAMVNYPFACSYNAKELRKACLEELTANMEMLKKNEMYPEMVQNYPQLVVDIYEYYFSKQSDILGS